MVAQKPRVLIFTGDNQPQDSELFAKFVQILTETTEKDKYVFEHLKPGNDHLIDFSPFVSDASVQAIILNNFSRKSPFCTENNQKALHDFVFPPQINKNGQLFRKILNFSPKITEPNDDVWLLGQSFSDKQKSVENVVDLLQKVVAGHDIPVNRQFIQMTLIDPQTTKNDPNTVTGGLSDDEFTVAVCKVDNSATYLDVSSESGSEIVFVVDSLENLVSKPKKFWSSLVQTILETPIDFEIPRKQQIAASIDTISVYTGHSLEKIDENLSQKLDLLAQHVSVKFSNLTCEKLRTDSANLLKSSKALILAPQDSKKEFDSSTQSHIYDYYRRGGKVLFLADPQHDSGLFWLLENLIKDKPLLKEVEQAFGKFATGHRVPENLQCSQIPGAENLALALVTLDGNLPLLYLSSEDGGLVAYGAVKFEQILQSPPSVWKDLLRVLAVGTLPNQDPSFTRDRVVNRAKDDVIKPKPPNLFLYTESRDAFQKYALQFKHTLHRDTYVVYQLTTANAKRVPWAPYCKVVFLADGSMQPDDEMRAQFLQFFQQNEGGRIVVFLDKDSYKNDPNVFWLLKLAINDANVSQEFVDKFKRFVETNSLPTNLITKQGKDDKNAPEHYVAFLRVENAASVLYFAPDSNRCLVYVCNYDAAQLFGANQLDADEVWRDLLRIVDLDVTTSLPTPLTSGYLYCRNEAVLSKTCTAMKAVTAESTPEMLFVRVDSNDTQSPTFPIRVGQKRPDFDLDLYQQSLKTKYLGEALIFIPVARSLMHFTASLSNLIDTIGLVTVARDQVSPPKETGKTWISPIGAATFSFGLKIPVNSKLGQNIGFVKCLAVLACYNGILATTEYADVAKKANFDLGIKWPDDLYYGKNYKIGGVMAKVVKSGDNLLIFYGFGVNVSNKRPTACLNDFVPENGPQFKVESAIGSILNEFEKLLDLCQAKGTQALVSIFNEHYVHINQEVKLMKSKETGNIVGVADDGNLLVKMKDGGAEIKVNSDPNVELCSNSLDCLVKIG